MKNSQMRHAKFIDNPDLEDVVLVAHDHQRHRAGPNSAQVRVVPPELRVRLSLEGFREGGVSLAQLAHTDLDARLRR